MIEINKIYFGDCIEVMKEIDEKSIDMILCDLPYGTTACKWDTIIPFDLLWKQYQRIIKDVGVIVLTGSEPFSSHLRLSNLKWYRYDWVWNKIRGANIFNLTNRPFKTHENIMIFSPQARFTFNPQRIPRTEKSLKRDPAGKAVCREFKNKEQLQHYGAKRKKFFTLSSDGLKHPDDIITFNVIENNRYKLKHPTKKPVKLFEYLIKTYTKENDLVLDNCAGSGTTGIACINLNRQYILIENNKEYFQLAENRIDNHLNQNLLRLLE